MANIYTQFYCQFVFCERNDRCRWDDRKNFWPGKGHHYLQFSTDVDVLFINAVDHFEKGKQQNNLLPEHIEKIIMTCRVRKKETRYSCRVRKEEIEKKEFNLNISRYVSTAVEEETVDLKEVNKKLANLDKEIAKARKIHNTFLEELGLFTHLTK